jgi:uncharacterized protein HemX
MNHPIETLYHQPPTATSVTGSNNVITAAFKPSRKLTGLQRMNQGLALLLMAALIITMALYSVVVSQKNQLQHNIHNTQAINEQNNALQVRLNQTRAFNTIAQKSSAQFSHLSSDHKPITLQATAPLLTPPSSSKHNLHRHKPTIYGY